MMLAIDIGNSNIVLGVFRGKELVQELRLKSDLGRTVDEYGALIGSMLERVCGSDPKFEGAIMASVVPPLSPLLAEYVERYLKVQCLMVGPGMKTGVSIRTDDPRAVGADRIVNAAAARALFGCPGIVVDMGTATTFDCVGDDGAYEGGAIAPGLGLAVDALVRNTAKLPKIELQWPAHVIGKNTISAMQSGSVIGYVCLVDGLIERIVAERGPVKYVVATGGLGGLVAQHSKIIKSYDPHLTLKGLRIIYELNQ